MNWKKAVTIGLLSITAVGLIGCSILLKEQKTTQTNAYYEITDYTTNVRNPNYNETTFTIEGTSTTGVTEQYKTIPTFTYSLKRELNGTTFSNRLNVRIQSITTSLTNSTPKDYTNLDPETNHGYNYWNDTQLPTTATPTTFKFIYNGIRYKRFNNGNIEYEVNIALQLNFTNNNEEFTYQTINTTSIFTLQGMNQNINMNAATGNTLEELEIGNTFANWNADITHAYQTGAGDNQVAAEVIDIRGTMLSVLTMPFTFINKAFDVTLWEGTAYAFNISNFIKGMIAIAAILFIIRLFTSGFSIIGNYTGGIANSRLDRQQKRANIEKTKAQTKQIGKTKEIHTTSEHTSHVYTHKDK